MFNHIFLTGLDSKTKSDLIDLLLKDKDYTGFRTYPYLINHQIKGKYLHSFVACPNYNNDLPITVHLNDDESVLVSDIMNKFGLSILEQSLINNCTIILMDELDYAGCKSFDFMDAFNRCLDSDKHIIGTLSSMDDALGALVFANNKSCILEITDSNQEQMLENLKRIIQQW